MRITTWLGCQPVIGLLVPLPKAKKLKRKEHYIIKHDLVKLYLRDPYRVRPKAGDPRSDWGQLAQAWRFGSEDGAIHAMRLQGWDGTVERVSYSHRRRTS